MVITGRPAGIVNIGGYRFPLRALQDAVRRINSGATLVALPYPFIGQRLGSETPVDRNADDGRARGTSGFNPLVVAAFAAAIARASAIRPRAA